MEEQIPDLERFSYDDAWEVGSALVRKCRENNLSATISIFLGDQRVFHAARPGTCADHDSWMDRKIRIVRRFRTSSQDVNRRFVHGGDFAAFWTAFGLSSEKYFPAGGAVPIFVGGSLAGVLCLSGLTSDEEHELAVHALIEAAQGQQAESPAATSG